MSKQSPQTTGAAGARRWMARHTPVRRAEFDALNQQVANLRREFKQLQAEVHDDRRLQRRVAEVTDIVGELLLPAADRDEDTLTARLEQYRSD